MRSKYSHCAVVLMLAACAHTSSPPVLNEKGLAVVVVRSDQKIALSIARTCEPIGFASAASDAQLKGLAAARDANLVEILYDSAIHEALLHRCPEGYDPLGIDL